MSAQQQIIRNLHKELKLAKLEIFSLQNRNDLQHSSWMLCDQCHREEVTKLKVRIAHLDLCLDGKEGVIFNLNERFDDELKATTLRKNRRSTLQRLVAYLFRL